MPSIAQMATSSSVGSSPNTKKRKRQQQALVDSDTHLKSNSPQTSLQFAGTHPLYNIELTDHSSTLAEPLQQRLFIIPRSLKLTRPHDTKRQRIVFAGLESRVNDPRQKSYEEDYIDNLDTRMNTGSTGMFASAAATSHSKPDLSSCHICHQKPKVRSDLDSYADCEGCGMRTCYICMRECLGLSQLSDEVEFQMNQIGTHTVRDNNSFLTTPHCPDSGGTGWGHRGTICSSCCIERGVDGEVRCLGCLRAEGGG